MLIDEFIEQLESIKKLHGNLRCFINGENGISDQKLLEDRFIFHAEACLTLSDEVIDQYQIEPSCFVVAISGY